MRWAEACKLGECADVACPSDSPAKADHAFIWTALDEQFQSFVHYFRRRCIIPGTYWFCGAIAVISRSEGKQA
jgi:hypothetical protein